MQLLALVPYMLLSLPAAAETTRTAVKLYRLVSRHQHVTGDAAHARHCMHSADCFPVSRSITGCQDIAAN